jgi:hypothetical protein
MVIASALVVSCAMPAHAGSFRVFDLFYEVWTIPNNDREIRILVGARAIYKGKVDKVDMEASWIINTHLNTTMYWERDSTLDDWEFSEHTGIENVGVGVPESNFMIECTPQNGCAVDAQIDRCNFFDESHRYRGHGAAGIYHHGGEDEFDEGTLGIEETECLTYEIGGTVSGMPRNPPVPLILQLLSLENLEIYDDGSFAFEKRLQTDKPFEIEVIRQPFGARCSVEPRSGTVEHEEIGLDVTCFPYCEAKLSTVSYPGDFAAAEAVNCSMGANLLDLGDGTVADFGNNLLWMKYHAWGSGGSFIGSAGEYCSELVLAGRDDWFVPDVAQLQTLLPVGTCDSAMEGCWSKAFDGDYYESGFHWTRTRVPRDHYCGEAWACKAHSWAVALGPGTNFGPVECIVECLSPERVWWKAHDGEDGGARVRCVTSINR